MFKFNFVQDGRDERTQTTWDERKEVNEPTLTEISLIELLDSLPSLISYSPLQIPSSGNRPDLFLSRRDLFDARFQLISQTGTEDSDQAVEGLEFLDAPSDLLPGVYEGGLKTWESSLDLVQVLSGFDLNLSGKRILEVGCGTAIPSAYLLRRLFALGESQNTGETHLYLQDFNRSVLELTTLPNILLSWYMSPSSASYRDAFKDGTDVDEDTEHTLPQPDPEAQGELPINPALVAAFLEALSDKNLHIHFLCGSWSTYNIDRRFDLILTSETMYRPESIPDLLDVLWKAHISPPSLTIGATLEGAVHEKLSLNDPRCYVAGKVLYFGVGGGLPDFISGLEDPRDSKCSRRNGKWEVLKENSQGVIRKVLQVSWD